MVESLLTFLTMFFQLDSAWKTIVGIPTSMHIGKNYWKQKTFLEIVVGLPFDSDKVKYCSLTTISGWAVDVYNRDFTIGGLGIVPKTLHVLVEDSFDVDERWNFILSSFIRSLHPIVVSIRIYLFLGCSFCRIRSGFMWYIKAADAKVLLDAIVFFVLSWLKPKKGHPFSSYGGNISKHLTSASNFSQLTLARCIDSCV